MILALVGLGIIQVWLIRSVPREKSQPRDITPAANETEQSSREDSTVASESPHSIWKMAEEAIEAQFIDALITAGAEYRAKPERMNVTGSGKDSFVTMMPPYSIRGLGEESVETDDMMLMDAVILICDLAGFKYNWNSNEAYRPLMHHPVQPAFEDVPWEEGMEQILKPYNLTYTIEGNTVTITRVGGTGKDALVTLVPPYAIWRKEVDPTDPKISIAGAVKAISNQAGYEFHWRISERNTARLTSEWIHPDFEDITWEEGMELILTPYDLTYIIEDNAVILTRPGGMEDIAENVLVTLKPPYTRWKAQSTKGNKIALQYAINGIGRQAGIDYNRKKSFENTKPICQAWIHPNIDNMPFKEAMKKILEPKGLTYTIKGNQIVLEKKKKGKRQSPSAKKRMPRSRPAAGFRTREVSLKPPFTGWNPDKRDPDNEISVRAAVGAICRQAGVEFDDERSYDNTSPLCERRISPFIVRETWEAAMEKILTHVGLDYVIENSQVVLVIDAST
jgi:hypothetical protein